ncbi:uncharacterized protein si:ch73-345f18.3 isoform X2 [Nerophis ophidion]|uniref:uncharacterized protein si:ch73-345f18.3 isoform X2 n=1 Tax=Nerophis ophidion TaxID=159077 RepID=UPI002ADF157E|nr:uncharacterized protein si:ch73-345f18.3 isoform X2 [Nerophis ophidion]
MLCALCTCCLSQEDERQPLLQTSTPQPDGAQSARKTRAKTSEPQATKQTGRLLMRRVCVQDLDLRFSDLAETFNELQGRYQSMIGHIGNLQRNCGCALKDVNISHCVEKICEEHRDTCTVSLTMKGYDFFLSAAPREGNNKLAVPQAVQSAQEEVRCLSENTKAAVSKGTTLQELIGWLLRGQVQMAEQVKKVAGTYQERGRLMDNLEENMREVSRAKELSLKYRSDAGEILTQAAHLAERE